jgi:hypothetical protein
MRHICDERSEPLTWPDCEAVGGDRQDPSCESSQASAARTSRRTVGREAPSTSSRSSMWTGRGDASRRAASTWSLRSSPSRTRGPDRGANTHQDRTAALRVAGHPNPHAAASHHSETFGSEECLDRRKVVPDDATGQLELASDRFDGRGLCISEQQTRDRRLPAIERNDRHGANLDQSLRPDVLVGPC